MCVRMVHVPNTITFWLDMLGHSLFESQIQYHKETVML